MTAARAFLLDTLRCVINGGDVGGLELDLAVPDTIALDRVEKNAWEELSHWADDVDIRARDGRYAASKRERMRDHVSALTANGG